MWGLELKSRNLPNKQANVKESLKLKRKCKAKLVRQQSKVFKVMKKRSFLYIIYIQLDYQKYEGNMKLFVHFQGLKAFF